MLTAIPRNWFSWDFSLDSDGATLAEIDTSSWREKGSVTASGTTYRMYREGFFSGAFLLETNGAILARARKPSSLTRRMVIDANGAVFELKPRSLFSRSYQLFLGAGVVGTLSPPGFLSRRIDVDLPESLPVPVKAFVVWLAVLLWRRDSNSG